MKCAKYDCAFVAAALYSYTYFYCFILVSSKRSVKTIMETYSWKARGDGEMMMTMWNEEEEKSWGRQAGDELIFFSFALAGLS
jgi:hypothetical protein